MLICHKLLDSNEAEVLQACHVRHACNIGSDYHASRKRMCAGEHLI